MRQSYFKQNNSIKKIILFIFLFSLSKNQLFSMENTEVACLQDRENIIEENLSTQFDRECKNVIDQSWDYFLLNSTECTNPTIEKYPELNKFLEMVGKHKKLIDEYKFNLIISRDSSDIYEQLKEECKDKAMENLQQTREIVYTIISNILLEIIKLLDFDHIRLDSLAYSNIVDIFEIQFQKYWDKKKIEKPDIPNILIKISNIIEKIDPSNLLVKLLQNKDIKTVEDLQQYKFRIIGQLFLFFLDIDNFFNDIKEIKIYKDNNQNFNTIYYNWNIVTRLEFFQKIINFYLSQLRTSCYNKEFKDNLKDNLILVKERNNIKIIEEKINNIKKVKINEIITLKKKSIKKLLLKNKKKKIKVENPLIKEFLLENDQYLKNLNIKKKKIKIASHIEKEIEEKVYEEYGSKIQKELNRKYKKIFINELLDRLVVVLKDKKRLENLQQEEEKINTEIMKIRNNDFPDIKGFKNHENNHLIKKRLIAKRQKELNGIEETKEINEMKIMINRYGIKGKITTLKLFINIDKKNKKEELLDGEMEYQEKGLKELENNIKKIDELFQDKRTDWETKRIESIKEILCEKSKFLREEKIKELKNKLSQIKMDSVNNKIVDDVMIGLRNEVIMLRLSIEDEKNKILIEKLKQELIDKKIMSESELENIEKDMKEKKEAKVEERINDLIDCAKEIYIKKKIEINKYNYADFPSEFLKDMNLCEKINKSI